MDATPTSEPIMRITTDTEYEAAVARKKEINRQLDECYSTVFGIPEDHPLDVELTQICEAIDAYLDAEVYASVYPCNF